jgi:hypothetical protein
MPATCIWSWRKRNPEYGSLPRKSDGRAPGDAHGLDVDASGAGVLTEPRMYQILRQPQRITDRTADIAFPDGNAEAFVITSG